MIEEFKPLESLGELTDFEKKFCPEMLYYKGDLTILFQARKVSVVGSRKASLEGLKRTAIIAKELVRQNITVVSGLAEGVDTIAHSTAIEQGGKTIAVLGTPLDKVFPKSNKDLFEKIEAKHLALSQFPVGYPTRPANFPRRNQTMALLSDATIIIEASEKSGTRHQGWEALRLGRMLFIMENVANDPALSWPKEMISYGAQVLTRDNFKELISEIPYLTNTSEIAF